MQKILKRTLLRRHPFRGIYKAIALEMGVKQSHVTRAIWKQGNPVYLKKLREHYERILTEQTDQCIAAARDDLSVLDNTQPRKSGGRKSASFSKVREQGRRS